MSFVSVATSSDAGKQVSTERGAKVGASRLMLPGITLPNSEYLRKLLLSEHDSIADGAKRAGGPRPVPPLAIYIVSAQIKLALSAPLIVALYNVHPFPPHSPVRRYAMDQPSDDRPLTDEEVRERLRKFARSLRSRRVGR